MPKFFCIGHFKTGTTSYSKAMGMLGLTDLHFPQRYAQAMIDADGPVYWSELLWDSMSNLHEVEYEGLQELYPDARFVLTTRNVDKWLLSIDAHMTRQWPPEVQALFDARFQKIYGIDCVVEQYDPALLRTVLLEHGQRVRDHFGDALCVLDLDSGDNLMDKLASFVGHPVRYPRSNGTGDGMVQGRRPLVAGVNPSPGRGIELQEARA